MIIIIIITMIIIVIITHKSRRVGNISSDFSINLDQPSVKNLFYLMVSQSIFEAISEEDNEWQALSQLMRSRGWTWCL